jgi:hypothetical protein
MANNACEHVAAQPEWLAKQTAGKSEADQKIWTSAYEQIHTANHYQKDEGPVQALERLKGQGLLQDLAIKDIPQEAHKLEKQQGKDGQPKNLYTTQDEVLPARREHQEIARFVERQIKAEQATRLAPSTESVQSVMTPERTAQMKAAGLETDPQALHDKMLKRMVDDRHLSGTQMEHMKSFPVGAPYVASGAVTGAQMDHLIREQKAMRDTKREDQAFKDLKACNPEEYQKQWHQYLKDTDVGHLLKVHAKEDPLHYKLSKIAAADSLVSALKELEKQK